MGRPSKRARVTRTAAEFDLRRLVAALSPPALTPTAYAWDLDAIRSARDDQLRGEFRRPAQLAKSMRTDDALFNAWRNRLAPLKSVGVRMQPASDTAAALRVADEAEALYGRGGIGCSTETVASIHSDLANHNVAVAILDPSVRDDGSRVDLYVRHWPIEWVRWDVFARRFVTQVDFADREGLAHERARYGGAFPELGAGWVPITHGDGRWLVFTRHESEPWAQDACLLAAALLWATRAFALRDWAQSSQAHGSAKLFGELPEGVQLVDASTGLPTPEAAAFIALLNSAVTGQALTGIRPSGSKTEFVQNSSTNWQIFTELVSNRERSAARIYLGTDGTLGAQGGAPGVDISALFGVASTIMQGDAECISETLFSGLLQVWTALNFGDSRLAPRRVYELPDSDAERWNEDFAKRNAAFHDAIKRTRENGFEITQDVISALAAKYRVPAPTLPAEAKRAPSIALAPTDLAVAVKVNEARASAGLGPLTLSDGSPDPDGNLPLSAYRAKVEAQAQSGSPRVEERGAPPPSNGAAPRLS